MSKKCIMVILDSNHTHKHVLEELEIYAPLVTQGSYCILPDTFIEFFPKGHYSHNRPWDVGNNPYTAMKEFLGKKKTTYSERKKASIDITKKILIENNYINKWYDFFIQHKKKDDLADCFLQVKWYIQK